MAEPCRHEGVDRAEYDLTFAAGDGKLDWCAGCGAVRVRGLKSRTAAMGDNYPQFHAGEWVSPVRAAENTGRKMRDGFRRGIRCAGTDLPCDAVVSVQGARCPRCVACNEGR